MSALRLAHRGDWRHAPENSLAAQLAALRRGGCDGLEFDVRLSADGVPVLAHDETLERVHGRPERVDALSVEELHAIGVATLDETLAAVGREPFLDVELKGSDHGAPTARVLARHRGNGGERAVVSSFEAGALRAMARLLPGWRRWLNATDLEPRTIDLAVALGCAGLSVDWKAIDKGSLARAAAADLVVAAWTVRRRSTLLRLERLGVTAVCIEGPALDG